MVEEKSTHRRSKSSNPTTANCERTNASIDGRLSLLERPVGKRRQRPVREAHAREVSIVSRSSDRVSRSEVEGEEKGGERGREHRSEGRVRASE